MATVSAVNNLSGFTHNPRGNIWMNDESGFGHKLLKKMGWSKGKGLGKDENGIKENIKVKVKGKNSGVGWKDESFLQVQNTEYDSVLKSINEACTGEKGTSTIDAGHKEKKSSSLEQRSQNFKNRLHFHKFVRGKDLSRYSEKDMKSIFILNKPVEEKKESHVSTEVSNTVDTYTSQLSVADYFAGKLQKQKDKKGVLTVYDEDLSSKNATERSLNDNSLPVSTKECTVKRKKGCYDEGISLNEKKDSTEANFESSPKKHKRSKDRICSDSSAQKSVELPSEESDTSKAEVEVSGDNIVASSDKKMVPNNFLKLDSALKNCLKSKVGNFSLKPLFNNKFSFQFHPGEPKKEAKSVAVENGNSANDAYTDNKSNYFDSSCNPTKSGKIAKVNKSEQETKKHGLLETQKKALKRKKETKRNNFLVQSTEIEETEHLESIKQNPSRKNYDKPSKHQRTFTSEEFHNFVHEKTGLLNKKSKYYNEWVASQRRALKMDHYRNMCINIMKDEVLKTSSLATIKGYGNCGLEE